MMIDQTTTRHQKINFYRMSSHDGISGSDVTSTLSSFPALSHDLSADLHTAADLHSSGYCSSDDSQASDSYVTLVDSTQNEPDVPHCHITSGAERLRVHDTQSATLPTSHCRQTMPSCKKRNAMNSTSPSKRLSSPKDSRYTARNPPLIPTARYVNNHISARQALWHEYRSSGNQDQKKPHATNDSSRYVLSVSDRRLSTGNVKPDHVTPQSQKQTCLKVQRTMSRIIDDLNMMDNPDLDRTAPPPRPPKTLTTSTDPKPALMHKRKMPLPEESKDQIVDSPHVCMNTSRLSVESIQLLPKRRERLPPTPPPSPAAPSPPTTVRTVVEEEENIYDEIDDAIVSEEESGLYETIGNAVILTPPHLLNSRTGNASSSSTTSALGHPESHAVNLNLCRKITSRSEHIRLPMTPPRRTVSCNFLSSSRPVRSKSTSPKCKTKHSQLGSNCETAASRSIVNQSASSNSGLHRNVLRLSLSNEKTSRRYSLDQWHPICPGRSVHPDNVVRGCDIVDLSSSKLYTVCDVISSMEELMSDNSYVSCA